MQRRDERLPLDRVGVPARGEQLLELVDHQDQARRLAGCGTRPARCPQPRPAAVLTASSTSIGASPGAADSDRYTETGSAPAMSASCIASSRNGLAVGRITRRGHRSDPGPSAPAASRGIKPALSSEDLPAPDSPATSKHARPVQPPGQPPRQLADQLTAPVENRRVLLLERHQPQVRAPRPPGPQTPGQRRAASTSAAGARPRAAADEQRRAPARPGPARRPAARRCPCGRCG